jgi:hypothetical protein
VVVCVCVLSGPPQTLARQAAAAGRLAGALLKIQTAPTAGCAQPHHHPSLLTNTPPTTAQAPLRHRATAGPEFTGRQIPFLPGSWRRSADQIAVVAMVLYRILLRCLVLALAVGPSSARAGRSVSRSADGQLRTAGGNSLLHVRMAHQRRAGRRMGRSLIEQVQIKQDAQHVLHSGGVNASPKFAKIRELPAPRLCRVARRVWDPLRRPVLARVSVSVTPCAGRVSTAVFRRQFRLPACLLTCCRSHTGLQH